MIQIRNNVFETNSSSTHSVCIAKEWGAPPDCMEFHLGEYGRSAGTFNAADYLYTAIIVNGGEYINKYMPKLIKFLKNNGVRAEFEPAKWEQSFYSADYVDYMYLLNGSIDHGDDAAELIEMVFNNEDLLRGILFGNSIVYTGSDEEPIESFPQAQAAFPTYSEFIGYDSETKKVECVEHDNPYHDPEHYVYFYKG